MKAFSAILLFLSFLSYGQKQEYPINSIQPELRKNANAVIRNASQTFSVNDKGNGTLTVKKVMTILNKEADRYATLVLFYDAFSTVKNVKGKVTDENGRTLKNIRMSDFYDYPSMASFSLYEDNRVLVYSPKWHLTYPYTLEFSYEIDYKGLLYTPTWVVQEAKDIAVEESEFVISYGTDYPLKFKSDNLEEPIKQVDGNRSTYTWKVKNLAAPTVDYDFEVLGASKPVVYTAPAIINLDGYVSNNDSWEDFGNWFQLLNQDRDTLGLAGKKKVTEITAGLTSDTSKVRAVYEYLQENTRYVNISLGIGGFQSFPATVVDEVGYGDCKALTTYTKAMLKSAGIESNYVLIRAGQKKMPFRRDFPSSQFNHVILSVPLEQDTVWLECTSQRNPYNFLGTFTDNREALWIKKDGSRIVNTPRYDLDDNLEQRDFQVSLKEDGSATIKAVVDFHGLRTENNSLRRIIQESEKDQKTWINTYFSIPSSELTSFEFTVFEEPHIQLTATLEVKNLAQLINKDLLLLNAFKLNDGSAPYVKKEGAFQVERCYQIRESVNIQYPEGFNPQVTEDEKIASEFAIYEESYLRSTNELRIDRTLKVFDKEVGEDSKPQYFETWSKVKKKNGGGVFLKSKT